MAHGNGNTCISGEKLTAFAEKCICRRIRETITKFVEIN